MDPNKINISRSNSFSSVASFTNTSPSASSSPGAKPAHTSRFVEQVDDFELPGPAPFARPTSPQPPAPGMKTFRFQADSSTGSTIASALQSALTYIAIGAAMLVAVPLVLTGVLIVGTIYAVTDFVKMVHQGLAAHHKVSADATKVKQD